MRMNHWKAVTVAAVFLMAVPAVLALAADKTTKTPKPAARTSEQAMPGCTMHGGADKAMPACGAKGSMEKGMAGCSKQGGEMKGCSKGGDIKGCCMKGGMGKAGCCKSGDMMACGMKGEMGKGMAGGPMCGPGMAGGPMCGPGMRGGPMGPGMAGGAGRGAMMLHGLDLTPDQQKKVEAIHERAQRQMIQQQADLRIATMDLQQLMRADSPDKGKIDAQIDKLAQLRAGMQKMHTATLLEVRALLTPEQLKKFQAGPMGGEEEDD